MRHDYESMIGQRFGKLTVKKYVVMDKKKYFLCRCDCGNEKLIDVKNVLRGKTRSCGCSRTEASKTRRISQKTIDQIIELRVSGMSYGQIGKRLGICRNTAYNYAVKNADLINKLINKVEEKQEWM